MSKLSNMVFFKYENKKELKFSSKISLNQYRIDVPILCTSTYTLNGSTVCSSVSKAVQCR